MKHYIVIVVMSDGVEHQVSCKAINKSEAATYAAGVVDTMYEGTYSVMMYVYKRVQKYTMD